ncbi:hypothetical protein N8T22_24560, partial [Enterobacter hormaechei subsp. steigerwaltii]|nr:hypothetical protein [Enterobacter hormaechei subsp. steigerwaltii]
FGFAENTDDLFIGKTLLHGDVLMWLMKTLLTSRCINQRGAGHVSRVFLPRLESLLDNQAEITAEFSCTKSVERLVKTAESNDGVVNYWA